MLREFFEKSQEPVFVILGTLILFVNQSAKALFDTNDLYELECTSKSFRVFEESHDFDGSASSTDSHQYMSLLDFIHAPTGLKEMLVSPSSSSTGTGEHRLFKVEHQPFIFEQKTCTVITLREVTQIRKVSELTAKNKFMQLMNSSVSHEMLAPLRCIVQISDNMRKKVPKAKRAEPQTILNTASFLLN